MEQWLPKFRELATAVVEQEQARRFAHEDARSAAGHFLRALIESIRPALRIICGPVAKSLAMVGGEKATVPESWRGFEVAPAIWDGGFMKARIWLTVEGDFRYQTFKHDTHGWTAESHLLADAIVAEQFPLADIAVHLAERLFEQQGDDAAAARRARQRADALKGWAHMLRALLS